MKTQNSCMQRAGRHAYDWGSTPKLHEENWSVGQGDPLLQLPLSLELKLNLAAGQSWEHADKIFVQFSSVIYILFELLLSSLVNA